MKKHFSRELLMTEKMLKIFRTMLNSFMLKYCFGRYKAQEKYDKAVITSPPALKFIIGQFVTCKMIKKLDNAV